MLCCNSGSDLFSVCEGHSGCLFIIAASLARDSSLVRFLRGNVLGALLLLIIVAMLQPATMPAHVPFFAEDGIQRLSSFIMNGEMSV